MKLILTQLDLENALRRYVGGLLTLSEGAKMDIEFTAGRGDKGMSAEVDINYLDVASIPAIQNTGTTTSRTPFPTQADLELPAGTTTDKKIDGRSKEARQAKGASIFGGSGGGTATEPATPPETAQEGNGAGPIDPATDALDLSGDDRAAEAEEILAEPEVEEVVVPPIPTGAPRKSLFS